MSTVVRHNRGMNIKQAPRVPFKMGGYDVFMTNAIIQEDYEILTYDDGLSPYMKQMHTGVVDLTVEATIIGRVDHLMELSQKARAMDGYGQAWQFPRCEVIFNASSRMAELQIKATMRWRRGTPKPDTVKALMGEPVVRQEAKQLPRRPYVLEWRG